MLGLDAAGKTTILYKLHIGEVLSTVPTIGESLDQANGRNLQVDALSFSGSRGRLVLEGSFQNRKEF